MWKDITVADRDKFNDLATHPLQSYEWGEFREKTGIKVIRKGFEKNGTFIESFQLTLHKIPHTKWVIGYIPKGTFPNQGMIDELKKIGKIYNCIFIQVEPNSTHDFRLEMNKLGLIPAAHPLFTKYTFQLDLTQSEEQLLKQMSQKTRYNIRVAKKYNVSVKEEHSQHAFSAYLQLTKETTNRQRFFSHGSNYHQLMWETLQAKEGRRKKTTNELLAHLFVASVEKQPLTTWIVFTFHDTLYYPYGASSSLHRETMSSNLMMWEVIKFGKRMGLIHFDMWGSLGPDPDRRDPWYGFHRFKSGYGPKLVEFIGSYDLVMNPLLYQTYKIIDKMRWFLLRFHR